MTTPARRGTLVLVPNTLEFGTDTTGPLDDALPTGVIRRAAAIDHWVVENAKSARAFIKRVAQLVALAMPLQSMTIRELPRPGKGPGAGPDDASFAALLQPALAGHDIGLLSEAGLPAVADPGATLVTQAHAMGLAVEPLPGASALLLALAASGLNGQQFAFVGYLPVKDEPRAARIRELEALSQRHAQTQIAIETPYRNRALLVALLEHLAPVTRLSVACALGWPGGWCRTQRVAQWRGAPPALSDRLPAVFLFQAA
ncbi:MAG: SAM-dependent methyltransferase [Ideonella sp.]|nr:SAM-dependent methyltransferase [Ideonella sp.]MCC7456916.1 SAM-dependent methyltransferase [Nitrospira sp.]